MPVLRHRLRASPPLEVLDPPQVALLVRPQLTESADEGLVVVFGRQRSQQRVRRVQLPLDRRPLGEGKAI